MRIIVAATGAALAAAWRAPTARRAAPVDHASEEEAWWRDMNTYGDEHVAPPPAPPPAREGAPARRRRRSGGRVPEFGPGGGDTTWSPDVWEFTPEADRARAGAGASAARVPHEQQRHEAPFAPPPDATPPIPPQRRKAPARSTTTSAARGRVSICFKGRVGAPLPAPPPGLRPNALRARASWPPGRGSRPEARATYDAELLRGAVEAAWSSNGGLPARPRAPRDRRLGIVFLFGCPTKTVEDPLMRRHGQRRERRAPARQAAQAGSRL